MRAKRDANANEPFHGGWVASGAEGHMTGCQPTKVANGMTKVSVTTSPYLSISPYFLPIPVVATPSLAAVSSVTIRSAPARAGMLLKRLTLVEISAIVDVLSQLAGSAR